MEGSSTNASPAPLGEPATGFETSTFERLLRRHLDEGRRFVGYDDAAEGLLLHHDVELSLDRALTLARLETTHRIDATFCLPLDAPAHAASTVTFDRVARTISRLGHDVGLLFDPHARWAERPDVETVREAVASERRVLEHVVEEPVDVVSFRDPPPWVRDLTLRDALNAERATAGATVVDRELRGGGADPVDLLERGRFVVHPGLWFPVERSESTVLQERRQHAFDRIDAYFEAFDVP